MGKKKIVFQIVTITLFFIGFSFINIRYKIITIPNGQNLIDRELDYITISTVFAGFAFTTLGLLMGFSSETYIKKIRNTNIIPKKVNSIIVCILYFLFSVVASLVVVLDFGKIFGKYKLIINHFSYIMSIGYLVMGMIYFSFSVKFLANLISRIYNYDKKAVEKEMDAAKEQLENTRRKLENMNEE